MATVGSGSRRAGWGFVTLQPLTLDMHARPRRMEVPQPRAITYSEICTAGSARTVVVYVLSKHFPFPSLAQPCVRPFGLDCQASSNPGYRSEDSSMQTDAQEQSDHE